MYFNYYLKLFDELEKYYKYELSKIYIVDYVII